MGEAQLRAWVPCAAGAGTALELPAGPYPLAHRGAPAAGLQGWHPQLLHPSAMAALGRHSALSGSCQLASCFPPPCDGRRSQGLIPHMPNGGEATVLPVPPGKPRAFSCLPAAKPKVLPRPPAAATVGSCFQQSIPGDPPRPCQKRCWGTLGRGDRAQGGMARGSSRVRKGHLHQPACLPPLPAPPPHAAASGPRPGAGASCRRSAAGLEESKGDGGDTLAGHSPPRCQPPTYCPCASCQPCGPSAHPACQRWGGGHTLCRRTYADRGGKRCHQDPTSSWRGGLLLGGLAHLPLLSSSASSSGM